MVLRHPGISGVVLRCQKVPGKMRAGVGVVGGGVGTLLSGGIRGLFLGETSCFRGVFRAVVLYPQLLSAKSGGFQGSDHPALFLVVIINGLWLWLLDS